MRSNIASLLLASACIAVAGCESKPPGPESATVVAVPVESESSRDSSAPISRDTATIREEPDSSDPSAVIARYYSDINARDFRAAYALWGNDGAASKQSFDQFSNGFAQTASVKVQLGEPGRIEGAAGSRYVDIPVTLESTLKSGERQTFTGTYTLRRAVVDGATAAQRRWHIYSAKISSAS